MSTANTRSGAKLLAGSTLKGNAFVFLGAPTDAAASLVEARFFIDGTQVTVDGAVPYDLKGTDSAGTAKALDTRTLKDGSHTVKVELRLKEGPVWTYSAPFTVRN